MGYKKITGIYKILNIKNNKCYVGSGVSVRRRLMDHKKRLIGQRHFNNHLQSSWNKYGESSFIFEIIEECSEDKLYLREEFWIKQLKSNNNNFGYNKRIDCRTNRGIKASDETKKKLSLSHLGHKRTKEAHEKIVRSQYKRVCQVSLEGHLIQIFESLKRASEITGIGRTNISMACRGKIPHAGYFYWCFEKDLPSFKPKEIPKKTGGWINGIRVKRK